MLLTKQTKPELNHSTVDLFYIFSPPFREIFLISSQGEISFMGQYTQQSGMMTFIEKINETTPIQVFTYNPENITTSIRAELAFIQGVLLSMDIKNHTYGNQEIFFSLQLQSNIRETIVIFSSEKVAEECEIFYSIQKKYEKKYLPKVNIIPFMQDTFDMEQRIDIFIEKDLSTIKIPTNNIQTHEFQKSDPKILKKIQSWYQRPS